MHRSASSPAHTSDIATHPGSRNYVGRFAPSPSGPLHFGSLVCALASYLDARANRGQWLVRIEDIDPPREQPGATDAILQYLELHHLHWDGEVIYQSQRSEIYLDTLQQLDGRSLSYRCDCSRKRLAGLSGCYDGYCQSRKISASIPAAIRLSVRRSLEELRGFTNPVTFLDGIQGAQAEDLLMGGDFIIHRKDGLFAYQLAVVVDDILQNITHVVRGADLLDTTARQILLFHVLGKPAPHYSHVPVMADAQGNKLSKQNRAPAIDPARAGKNLYAAMRVLGLNPGAEQESESPENLIEWAVARWHPGKVGKKQSIIVTEQ